ncbi:hypothetical protein CCACVL1_18182 [Corchorus capsularis]|uniref:Uncharacterized protein n=1 Tax=Corchorus capsularis TaxID=210143 RepID=A0A1R3HMI1_COCAP|nr:hypothetical protein CCACVL1_18182 [Corchorus capsularis]
MASSSITFKPFLGATKPNSSLSSDLQRLSFSSLHISVKPRTHKKLQWPLHSILMTGGEDIGSRVRT